jgi:hypothetical protein
LSAFQTLTFVLIGNLILSIKGMYLSYWLVLFSVSCFANVLGLNISSAFNSAITIYIIIPILLIPQILLSGVVVQFDQLNPTFGAKTQVPIIGDVMASRWAYEALMVTQYKDNKYKKHFYEIDKRMNQSEFQLTYYLPKLESMSEFVHVNRKVEDEMKAESVQLQFDVLMNELSAMRDEFGPEKFTELNGASIDTYDSMMFNKTRSFLGTIRRIHLSRQKRARNEKQEIISKMTNTPAQFDAYQKMIRDYTNNQVTSLVLDNKETTRILEHNGRLVQKIYPIYMDPIPTSLLDFRTQFYLPQKHFLGYYFGTLYFNVIVMWSMTVFLIVALYYDLLRKLINADRPVSKKTRK